MIAPVVLVVLLTSAAPSAHLPLTRPAVAQSASVAPAVPSPSTDVLTDIRVQGNLSMPDADVIRLAGIQKGMPVDAGTAERVAATLRATKRFERVEVRRRFASIADPTQVALVIIVDEGPVHVEMTGDPANPTRIARDRGPRLLYLPVIDAEDGYGVTYGVRVAMPNVLGAQGRLSFPLTWGGEKRAAVEADKRFTTGVVNRLFAGASVSRREHPFYQADEDRLRAYARVEHAVTAPLRLAVFGGVQRVSFLGARDTFGHVGVDVTVDTRLDPVLARNAVFARAAWEALALPGGVVQRIDLDGRAYIGLPRSSILVARVQKQDADSVLPPYLEPVFGGASNVRGFRAGTAVGDTLTAGSLELLVPLTSPLRFGKFGVNGVIDVGAAYDKGQRLADVPLRRSYGGGLWFSAAFVRVNALVAHGVGGPTRVLVTGGVSF